MSQLLNDPPHDFPTNSVELQDKQPVDLVLDGFLRREQLAEQLGKSARTLDRWNSLRNGPPRVCVGRTILYRVDSVREWLRSREQQLSPSKRPRKFPMKPKLTERGG